MEQDAAELRLLLQQIRSFEPVPSSQDTPVMTPKTQSGKGHVNFKAALSSVDRIDTTIRDLMDQIKTELAKKPPLSKEQALRKIQTMWRIRKARKQLKELVRSVYKSFVDPSTGLTYYLNTKTNTTQWTKPKVLGHESLEHGSRQKRGRCSSASLMDLDEGTRRDVAARRIQGMVYTNQARRQLRRLISSVYEKIWDDSSKRFYYHNTRTNEVNWERPRWVNDEDLLTPRRRSAKEQHEARASKVQALRSTLTEETAAQMVQRAFRRRRGFKMLVEMCRRVYERIYDPATKRYYYHNTRTKETSWEKPLLLRDSDSDVLTPRTRLQALSLVQRINPSKPTIEWTPELAAAKIQGCYRGRKAHTALKQRLLATYKRIKDDDSGRYYYFNSVTEEVTWDKPALLSKAQIEALEWDGE